MYCAIRVAGDHVALGVECRRVAIPARGKRVERIVVFLGGQAKLLQVVLALGTIRRFSRGLHRRHDQSDEHGDDGDDDEQLDQGERCSRPETITFWCASEFPRASGDRTTSRLGDFP